MIGCTSSPIKEFSSTASDLTPPSLDAEFYSTIERVNEELARLESLESMRSRQVRRWWLSYRKAQLTLESQPQKSCKLFTQLAGEARFALRRVAQINAHKTCKASTAKPPVKDLPLESFKPWERGLALNVALKKALQNKHPEKLVKLALEKSK